MMSLSHRDRERGKTGKRPPRSLKNILPTPLRHPPSRLLDQPLTTRTLSRAITNNYHHQGRHKRHAELLDDRPLGSSGFLRLRRGARMHDSLRRVANEIQRHKAGWLASGAHKYLDDRGPIARPRGCVRTAALARAARDATPLHTPSLDLELIREEVSRRYTGNLTEARPRKSRWNREKEEKERGQTQKGGERERGTGSMAGNSYTHPVCG